MTNGHQCHVLGLADEHAVSKGGVNGPFVDQMVHVRPHHPIPVRYGQVPCVVRAGCGGSTSSTSCASGTHFYRTHVLFAGECCQSKARWKMCVLCCVLGWCGQFRQTNQVAKMLHSSANQRLSAVQTCCCWTGQSRTSTCTSDR